VTSVESFVIFEGIIADFSEFLSVEVYHHQWLIAQLCQ